MNELTYEKISQKDIEGLQLIWSDKDVIKYTNIKNPCTIEETKEKINIFENHDVFAIKFKDKVVGIIGCPCINKEKHEYGVFYQLNKNYWNKKIATKSMSWILGYMKNKYEKVVLFADVVSDNIASDKILNKFGFKYEYTEEKIFQRDDKKMDIKHYKLDNIL